LKGFTKHLPDYGHAEGSWTILTAQNLLPAKLFHAFLVESEKHFESCSSMETFAAAQFTFPCFSLSQAHADLLLLVLKGE